MKLKAVCAALLLGLASLPALAGVQFAKAEYSVNEGDKTLTISVIRTGSAAGPVSVSYATSKGPSDTASPGVDFADTTGTVSWADLDADAKTITIPITDDQSVEPNETFTLSLLSPIGTTLGAPSAATVTIVDNDSVGLSGSISLAKNTYSVSEGAGTAQISVVRTGGSSGAVSASYTLSAGTATAGSDYTDGAGTLTWADGDSTAKMISVPIIDDSVSEATENFVVAITNVTGASPGAPSSASVSIVDNDQAPPTGSASVEFLRASSTISESGGSVSLTLVTTGTLPAGAKVAYSIVPGSAKAGSDYVDASGFIDLATTDKVVVQITNDTVLEGDENFSVQLSNPVGVTLGANVSAAVTIIDDETASSGTLSFDAPGATVSETGGTVQLSVSRMGGTSGAVSVSYASADGSAVSGDYTPVIGSLRWANGEAGSKTITIPINDDKTDEGDEDFTVSLTNATGGAALGSQPEAKIIIVDDEHSGPGEISILGGDAFVSEAAGTAIIYVARTGGSRGAVSVSYLLEPGTAGRGTDFNSGTGNDSDAGVLTWDDGDVSVKAISVSIVNDTVLEPTETFAVELVNPTNGVTLVGGTLFPVAILDDDGNRGVLQFSADQYRGDAGTGTVQLIVRRVDGATGAAKVDVETADGTAVSGTDYTGGTSTLSWADGDATSRAITIRLTSSSYHDRKLDFTAFLSNNEGALIGSPSVATVQLRFDRGEPNSGCTLGGPGGPMDPTLWMLIAAAVGIQLYRINTRKQSVHG